MWRVPHFSSNSFIVWSLTFGSLTVFCLFLLGFVCVYFDNTGDCIQGPVHMLGKYLLNYIPVPFTWRQGLVKIGLKLVILQKPPKHLELQACATMPSPSSTLMCFLYMVKGSNFILCLWIFTFPTSFSYVFLAPLLKISCAVHTWTYFQMLYSASLVYA